MEQSLQAEIQHLFEAAENGDVKAQIRLAEKGDWQSMIVSAQEYINRGNEDKAKYWRNQRKLTILRQATLGTLIGQAIGDALGLGTEFMSREEVKKNYPYGFDLYCQIIQDGHRSRWQRGAWTDDTDMMLCIADAIIENSDDTQVRVEPMTVARNFKKWFLGTPMGIGRSTYLLLGLKDYEEKPFDVAETMWSQYYNKQNASNGAVMRTSIIGLLPTDVEKHAEDICKLTHPDPRCVASCVIVSKLIHSLVYGHILLSQEELVEIGRRYDDRVEEYLRMAFEAKSIDELHLDDPDTMGYTLRTLAAGVWAVYHCDKFEDALVAVVNAGGDADTNAAVVCSLMGAREGYTDIPKTYIDNLVGKDRLLDTANKILELLLP